METNDLICRFDPDGETAVRYLAGELSAEQVEAFEAHYFGCEECWQEVRRAAGLRAAFDTAHARAEAPSVSPGSAPTPVSVAARVPWRRGRTFPGAAWRPLAAAAVMAFLALGVWRLISDREPPYDETARAPDGTLPVSAYTSGPVVIAAWSSVPRAAVYHVRLFGEDGVVLVERDIADTTIVVDVATLPPQATGSALYWEIDALDPLRQVLARSGLRKVLYPEDPGP